jgi:exopolyphosphatase/guanosine-5'-triphosphate,3'-diphosphate pyrophosphatase
VLLRLAVVLHRGRSRQPLPPLSLEVNARRVALRFPSGWLDEHPLTRADLEAEARYLKKAGFRLEFG